MSEAILGVSVLIGVGSNAVVTNIISLVFVTVV